MKSAARSNFLACCALCLVLATVSMLKQKAGVDPLEEHLGWLPRRTKMVFVSRGPFRTGSAHNLRDSFLDTCKVWNLPVIHPMELQTDNLPHSLRDCDHAVLGVTRFKDSSMVEGCRLVQMKRQDTREVRALVASRCRVVKGYEIPVWEKTYEYKENLRDTRTTTDFYCFPSPDCLLVAYDKESLKETLSRSRQSASVGLPPQLQRWRGEIAADSPFWGIRSEDCQISDLDPYYGEPVPSKMPPSSPSSLTMDWSKRGTVRVRFHGWNSPKLLERDFHLKLTTRGKNEFETEISPRASEDELRYTAGEPAEVGITLGFMKLNLLLGFRWWI